jgi:hypothetical protein
MKQPNEVAGRTVNLVKGLFHNILESLPAGCASLRVDPIKEADFFGMSLVPANERSAEFGAIVFGDALYSVDFGRKPTFTCFECPWEINLPRSAGLDRQLDVLAKMCLAVTAGKCEHRFERRSTRGVIYVSEKEAYRVRDMHLMTLFRPRRNPRTLQYAPYFPGAETMLKPSQDYRYNPIWLKADS